MYTYIHTTLTQSQAEGITLKECMWSRVLHKSKASKQRGGGGGKGGSLSSLCAANFHSLCLSPQLVLYVCIQSKCGLKLKGRKGKGRERLYSTYVLLVSDIIVGIVGMQYKLRKLCTSVLSF